MRHFIERVRCDATIEQYNSLEKLEATTVRAIQKPLIYTTLDDFRYLKVQSLQSIHSSIENF